MVKTRLGLCVVGAAMVAFSGGVIAQTVAVDPRPRLAALLRRHQQVPLGTDEALVAASWARNLGDQGAERELLARAASGGDLAEVARVELAEALVAGDRERAVELVLPTLHHAGTRSLEEAAVEVAVRAVTAGVVDGSRTAVLDAAGL